MVIELYVNWKTHEIVPTSEWKSLASTAIRRLETDENAFNEWLDSCYYASEIFSIDEKRRSEIQEEWHQVCVKSGFDLMKENWSAVEITVAGQ